MFTQLAVVLAQAEWKSVAAAPETWTMRAVVDSPFADYTDAELGALMGTQIVPPRGVQQGLLSATELLAQFDSRDHFGKCIHPVRNQQKCGSCWAFGASETLSDNLCVLSHGATDVVLSPQDLVSCDGDDSGCNGGALPFVWMYIEKEGIVADTCMPYTAGNGTSGQCRDSCVTDEPEKAFKCPAGHAPSVWDTAAEMQRAIQTYGAVESAFMVYSDFMHYESGVYKHTGGKLLGGHAIKVVGWGHDDEDQLYWIVQNSWGPEWGMGGFFQIYDWSVDAKSQFAKQGGYSCGVTELIV